jgi:hypothetical protein
MHSSSQRGRKNTLDWIQEFCETKIIEGYKKRRKEHGFQKSNVPYRSLQNLTKLSCGLGCGM